MHLRDLTQFLSELSENNNRAWFVMNKPRYDILRAEFLEMTTGLIAQIAQSDPFVGNCIAKKALFRVNRDMRFSHDKSPYKTFFSASINAAGRKKPSKGGGPSYYFQVNGQGRLMMAAGEWLPPADRLKAIREHIAADPKSFTKIVTNKAFITQFNGLQEEGKLKRAPKGFDIDHPQIESIKLKHFIVWCEVNMNGLMPEAVTDHIVKSFRLAQPLVMWLRSIKTPTLEED